MHIYVIFDSAGRVLVQLPDNVSFIREAKIKKQVNITLDSNLLIDKAIEATKGLPFTKLMSTWYHTPKDINGRFMTTSIIFKNNSELD